MLRLTSIQTTLVCCRTPAIIKQQRNGTAFNKFEFCVAFVVVVSFFVFFFLVVWLIVFCFVFVFQMYESFWSWRAYQWNRKQKLERAKEDFVIPRKQQSQHFRPVLPENWCICEFWGQRKTIKTCRRFLCLEAYEMSCCGSVGNVRWKDSGERLGKGDGFRTGGELLGEGEKQLILMQRDLHFSALCSFCSLWTWEAGKNEAYYTFWC